METTPSQTSSKRWLAAFLPIWVGQAFSLLGSQLVQFALIWWLTKTTGSAAVLATATLVGLLPQVFLGPIAGTLVDRWNRRVVMIVADSVIALATVGLALLFWFGQAEIWQVYLLMFVRAAAGAFHWPAMQASTSLMVPKEHFARIQGFNQMLMGGLSIFAAPLGALLLELLPMQGILAIDIGTALLAVVPLLFVAIPQPERRVPADGEQRATVWQEFKVGIRYVASWPGLLMIMLLAMMINLLLTPASSLQPLLVTKHFGGEALQLAWLESAFGVGMILGGLLLSAWGGFRRQVVTSLVGLVGLGLGMLLIGLTPASAFTLAIVAAFIVGVTQPIVNGPLIAVVQAAVEPEMQGRVFTLIASGAAAMSPLGLLIAAPVADYLGIRTWYIVGGVVTVLLAILSFSIPAIIKVEEGRPGIQIGQHGAEAPHLVPAPVPVEASQISSKTGD
jgi:DHA3 family macrolide efflux protein-like MFS transporter